MSPYWNVLPRTFHSAKLTACDFSDVLPERGVTGFLALSPVALDFKYANGYVMVHFAQPPTNRPELATNRCAFDLSEVDGVREQP